MKRACLHLAYVFLLLFSQQVALAHAVSHTHGQTPAHQDGKGKAGYQGGLCAQHGMFAQVLGGVQAAGPLYQLRQCTGERSECRFHAWQPIEFHSHYSRGPPVLS